ncbi:glycosyltransferase [Haloplanus sp. GCM10025708]|uniref:glycosyltransferase n=1 Tax=Haloferacaceae TaxID=1644056 RepID=UPI003609BB6F
MADILVVHPTLMAKGGGESVCMNVLEALEVDYNVDLLTSEIPDFDELNAYYGTSVSAVGVRPLNGGTGIAQRIPTMHFTRFKVSLLNRYLTKHEIGSEYDLVFSTYNDLQIPYPSIQYIHHPNFNRTVVDGMGRQYPTSVYSVYDALCEYVAHAPDDSSDVQYLTNSDWMGDRIAGILGERPQTVYPPVLTDDIRADEWSGRENGFVTIGRVSPEKNVLRNIEILARLDERGHDVHYHILGPSRGSPLPFESYQDRVESRAADYPFVHLEGEVSRERLVELVQSHKYGLHGMDHEHFGIAVAELVAGGTIPFVPRGGGQVEVVDRCEDVLYDSVDDAVEKIDRVLSDEAVQRDVRERLPDVEERFGRERFQREIREITNDALS